MIYKREKNVFSFFNKYTWIILQYILRKKYDYIRVVYTRMICFCCVIFYTKYIVPVALFSIMIT